MKLKAKFEDEDFKLGEVVDANIATKVDGRLLVQTSAPRGGLITHYYSTLKEFVEKWEDAPEEPKEYWYIDCDGEIEHDKDREDVPEDTKGFWYIRCGGAVKQNEDSSLEKHHIDRHKEIGNYFETEEEAEKAVEKLKALTEAKEDGLKIKGYYYNHEDLVILADIGKCNKLTLDTLFGKEID